MDLALRDRQTVHETEDQAIFLTALDGMTTKEAVVFVFTTNCPLELIDRAFKRPGRIDVALQFKSPDAALRRQLIQGWHEEIRNHLNVEEAVVSTDGYSFAEIEELKNLLIMHFMDEGTWDWAWAMKQFHVNREDLAQKPVRHAGF
jgi:ATP-dependent 26S proteasome regulatory subunit